MISILFFGLIILFVYVVYKLFTQTKKNHRQIVTLYTGTIGSGKSYIGTSQVSAHYFICNVMYHLYPIFHKVPILKKLTLEFPPRVYSTIPLQFGIFKRKYAQVLTLDHLTLKEKLSTEHTNIVYIDEIGSICNQYSYNDTNVISTNVNDNWNCLENFIRYFRHHNGANCRDMCRIICNDQATGNVNVSIRRRLSEAYELSNFRRFLFVLPFYIVDVRKVIISDDNIQNVNEITETKNVDDVKKRDYFMGWLPYTVRNKIYNSHCYQDTYLDGCVGKKDFSSWSSNDNNELKTNYIPDIRSNKKLK